MSNVSRAAGCFDEGNELALHALGPQLHQHLGVSRSVADLAPKCVEQRLLTEHCRHPSAANAFDVVESRQGSTASVLWI